MEVVSSLFAETFEYFESRLRFFIFVGVVINIILFVRRRPRVKSLVEWEVDLIFEDPDLDKAANLLIDHLSISIRCFEADADSRRVGPAAEPSYTTASLGYLQPPNFYTCSSCRGQAFPCERHPADCSLWNPKPSSDPCDPARWLRAWKSIVSDHSKSLFLRPTTRLRQLRNQISLILLRGREFDIYVEKSEGEAVVSHRALVTMSHFEGSQFDCMLRGFEMTCYIAHVCEDDPGIVAQLPRCCACESANLLSRWSKIQEKFSSDDPTRADPLGVITEMVEILEDARNIGRTKKQDGGHEGAKCHLECFRQLKLVPCVDFIQQNDKACEKFALLLEKLFMMVGEEEFVRMIKEHDKTCGLDAGDYIKQKILVPSLKQCKRKDKRDVFVTVIDALPKSEKTIA